MTRQPPPTRDNRRRHGYLTGVDVTTNEMKCDTSLTAACTWTGSMPVPARIPLMQAVWGVLRSYIE